VDWIDLGHDKENGGLIWK